jgi:hypothetical protein
VDRTCLDVADVGAFRFEDDFLDWLDLVALVEEICLADLAVLAEVADVLAAVDTLLSSLL